MQTKRWLFLLVIFLGAGPALLSADVVNDLYETGIPVSNQDRKERRLALQTALREILVRISGRREVAFGPPLPEIEAALNRPARYTQQFRYRKLPVAAEHSDASPEPADQADQLLWVRFDEAAVNDLLRRSGLPVWGRTRPATLVWLAIDDRGQRFLVGNNVDHEARHLLQSKAQRRGMPLRLPLLDLNDQTSLRVSDVWGNFEENIQRASQRYQPEAIMVGRVYQGYGGFWHARWMLYLEGRRFEWSRQGGVLAEVLDPGIDAAADTLAQHFAQNGDAGDNSHVLVEVNGLHGLEDYNRVIKYLTSLSAVTAVQPAMVSAGKVMLRMNSVNGRLGVAQAVALGHVLVAEPRQEVSAPVGQANPAATQTVSLAPDLVYRLLR